MASDNPACAAVTADVTCDARASVTSLTSLEAKPIFAGAHPSQLRLRSRLAILNGTGDRRFWLSARALLERRALQ